MFLIGTSGCPRRLTKTLINPLISCAFLLASSSVAENLIKHVVYDVLLLASARADFSLFEPEREGRGPAAGPSGDPPPGINISGKTGKFQYLVFTQEGTGPP